MLGDHLGLKSAKIPKGLSRAVVHGDPDRVAKHAELLDEIQSFVKKRGFVTCIGKYEGLDIVISSIGMGSGSASIAIEELIELGINRIIRVGTCGAYRNDIKPGDLIVPTEVLIDGPILRYICPNYIHDWPPKDLPKWAYVKEGFVFVDGFHDLNGKLVNFIIEELKGKDYSHRYFLGPIHDKDILHAWRLEYNLKPHELNMVRERVRRLTIATDMETGSLFTISHLRGIKSGSILTVVNFLANEEELRAQNEALEIAYRTSLKTLANL
ncbi:MAG: hypothetical protein NZ896_04565 [Nitrososphaerales archaeon]|nr:hypothetical protein [Nitrososphaerales archaeon]